MLRISGFIDRAEANFLKGEIESGNNARAKRALQIVCRLYRSNKGFLPGDNIKIENAVIGALASGRSDEKVRRWSLSALSQFGSSKACWTPVATAIQGFPDEPQVLSAGIAALFKMDRTKAATFLSSLDTVSSEILTLSARQAVGPTDPDIPSLTLNVDNSDPTTLKLGLVLVGLDQSPEFLFHEKHPNKVMVKDLGGHDDPLVSQYSAWAVAENKNMTIADLGIDLYDIGGRPENVRHYVYRLIAAENEYSLKYFDILNQGSTDESDEARMGTAMGLRDTYYEGIQDLTLKWISREDNDQVLSYVIDHVVRHASKQPLYERRAIELFVSFASDGAMRERMMAAAAATPISREFKKILHEEDDGLFGKIGAMNVTNNIGTLNMQGVNSISGNSHNSGQQMNVTNNDVSEQIIEKLLEVKSQIEMLNIDEELRKEALAAVSAAQQEPTPTKVQTAVAAIKKVAGVLGATTTYGSGLVTIADFLIKAVS